MVTVSELLYKRKVPPSTQISPETIINGALTGAIGIYTVTRVNALMATGKLPAFNVLRSLDRAVYVASGGIYARALNSAAADMGLTKHMNGWPASLATAFIGDYAAGTTAAVTARATGLTKTLALPAVVPTAVVAATRTAALRVYRPYVARALGKLPSDIVVTGVTGFAAGVTAGATKSAICDRFRGFGVATIGTGLAVATSLTMQQMLYSKLWTHDLKKK